MTITCNGLLSRLTGVESCNGRGRRRPCRCYLVDHFMCHDAIALVSEVKESNLQVCTFLWPGTHLGPPWGDGQWKQGLRIVDENWQWSGPGDLPDRFSWRRRVGWVWVSACITECAEVSSWDQRQEAQVLEAEASSEQDSYSALLESDPRKNW